jgi:hypothetical protein
MPISAASKLEGPHPPLARDAMGNLLAMPDGTAAWRICRETAGRPGEIKGPDRQAFRFPLDTTSDELADMCGPGVYRVYALDEVGKQLGYVSTWDLTSGGRELRNGTVDTQMLSAVRPNSGSAPTTDLRFALEAMTAMMRTNSEALPMVAESHVDLAKTIAAAKGLPRNAPVVVPAAAAEAEDDDVDEDVEERPPHWVELVMPFAEKVAEVVPALVMGKVMPQSAMGHSASREQGTGDADLASKPSWELRDLVDLNYAAAKAKARRAANQAGDAGAPATQVPLQARVMADPKLLAQFIAIKSLLTTDEAARLLALGQRMTEQEQEWLLAQVSRLNPEQAAALLRGMLVELNAAEPPTDPTK